MTQTKIGILRIIAKIFDPRKSPILYFLLFFLLVPAIVYGIVGTGVLETGSAASYGSWIEITTPAEGQSFTRGTSVSIVVRGFAEQLATLSIDVNGVALTNCGSEVPATLSVNGSFSKTCYWDASFSGTMTAQATIVPAESPVMSSLVTDKVTFRVVAESISYTWLNPSNRQNVSGQVSFQWLAGGFEHESALDATKYSIYLDMAEPVLNGVNAGTLVASGTLGTTGTCSLMDYGGLWQCSHPTTWSTLSISNGTHTLTGILSKVDVDGGQTTQSEITINVDNTDNLPICDLVTLSDNDIYSGESVTITATGHDPDGTVITDGWINYGNQQSSDPITAQNGAVSATYSGYILVSGSAQYSVSASFKSNNNWGAFGCAKTITVRARPGGNTCPVISSSPLKSVKVGSTYSYTLRYTDDDNVILKAVSKPGWLSWNATTGVLSGIPSSQHIGTHSVVLAVDDGDPACHTQQSFAIRVWDDTDDDSSDDGDDGDVGGSDTQAPVVVVTSPGAGSQFSCESSTAAWTVTDDGTIEKIWIEYSQDGETWIPVVNDLAGTATSYNWNVCSLTLGTYYVRVWARDNDGNERAGTSNSFEIVSLGTTDQSPRITDPIPEPDSNVLDTKPNISAKFVPADSAIDVQSVLIKLDNKLVTAYATVTADGFSYIPTDELSDGEHTIYVKVSDEEDRSTEKEWIFTVVTSTVCTFAVFGLTLPCWVLYALIVCGALLLILIIIVAIVRLVALAKENKEEEELIKDERDDSEGDSWAPPVDTQGDTGYSEPGRTVPPVPQWQNPPSDRPVEDKQTVEV